MVLQQLLKKHGYSEENHQQIIELLKKNEQKEYIKYAIFRQRTEDLAILAAKKPEIIEFMNNSFLALPVGRVGAIAKNYS